MAHPQPLQTSDLSRPPSRYSAGEETRRAPTSSEAEQSEAQRTLRSDPQRWDHLGTQLSAPFQRLSVTGNYIASAGDINSNNVIAETYHYHYHAPSNPDVDVHIMFEEPLKPQPDYIIGREEEGQEILTLLLKVPGAHVAVLGTGGVGKTTLALWLLKHAEVAVHYSRRYFVTCEHATTVSAVLNAIANVLHIPREDRGPRLRFNVFGMLRKEPGTIICLDNFEDPWDTEGLRAEVEELLYDLGNIPNLAILITMRGSERPRRIKWTHPPPQPIHPLSSSDAATLFMHVSHSFDQRIPWFVEATGGLPLAIELLAQQVENDGMDEFMSRWEKEDFRTLDSNDGQDHRLSSVNFSIPLSLRSTRIVKIPAASKSLRILATLPSGFGDYMTERIQRSLPPEIDLARALRVLLQSSLVYQDSSRRYRLLPPIRQYTMQFISLDQKLLLSFIDVFVSNVLVVGLPENVSDPSNHQWMKAEIVNTTALLHLASQSDWRWSFTTATIILTRWGVWTGTPSVELVLYALNQMGSDSDVAEQRGNCYRVMGDVYRFIPDLDKSEAALLRAVELHKQAGDVLGQANDIYALGELYLYQDRLDDAERLLLRAVELHKQAHSILGEANDTQILGRLYMNRDRLDDAEMSFLRAEELHKLVRSVLGEANDIQQLGKLYMLQNRPDDAEKSLLRALELHKQAHSTLGEAFDIRKLGELYMGRDRLDDAERSLLHALELHKQAPSVLGEANSFQKLGELYMLQDQLNDAERFLLHAAERRQHGDDIRGDAYDAYLLGKVFIRQSRLDDAETSLERSLKLYNVTHDASLIQKAQELLNQLHTIREDSNQRLWQHRMDEYQTQCWCERMTVDGSCQCGQAQLTDAPSGSGMNYDFAALMSKVQPSREDESQTEVAFACPVITPQMWSLGEGKDAWRE